MQQIASSAHRNLVRCACRNAVRRRRRRRRRRAPRAAAADRQVVREGERDEDEHADQVHRAGDQPHRLRHLRALHRPHERAARVALRLRLVQVDPEEPRLDERRAHREREPRRDDVPEAREQHAHRERRRRPKVAGPQQRRRRADRGGEHERLVLRERHRKFGGGLESWRARKANVGGDSVGGDSVASARASAKRTSGASRDARGVRADLDRSIHERRLPLVDREPRTTTTTTISRSRAPRRVADGALPREPELEPSRRSRRSTRRIRPTSAARSCRRALRPPRTSRSSSTAAAVRTARPMT